VGIRPEFRRVHQVIRHLESSNSQLPSAEILWQRWSCPRRCSRQSDKSLACSLAFIFVASVCDRQPDFRRRSQTAATITLSCKPPDTSPQTPSTSSPCSVEGLVLSRLACWSNCSISFYLASKTINAKSATHKTTPPMIKRRMNRVVRRVNSGGMPSQDESTIHCTWEDGLEAVSAHH